MKHTTVDMQGSPSPDWTVGTLRETVRGELEAIRRAQDTESNNMREMIGIRFTSMEKLLSERYETQTKAQVVAFAAAAEAVATALSSAKEATNKAEFNAGARFDQFRIESQGQIKVVADKLDSEIKRISELTNAFSTAGGQATGAASTRNTARLDAGQLITVVSLLIAAFAVITGLFFR